MNEGQKKAAPKRGDVYLIGGCLLAALVCCGLWLGLRKQGGAVIVEQEGRETARYALHEDRTVKIEGEGGYNTLVIEGGQVWLSEADCPNLLCVKTGKIRYAGQSIVCLPHKLAVRIVGGASPLDAVTGGIGG
ncbi:MAG: NusG domain II-containing protein [Clostridia bacterium]|nr:NusG domain II-containing protein [Clostridia bacterium]